MKKPFEGVVINLERRYKETDSDWARERSGASCPRRPALACKRRPAEAEALAVKVAGCTISEVTRLSVKDAGAWFQDLSHKLNDKQREIAVRILKENSRQAALPDGFGLEYLSLGRSSGTLSGGESQRIRLASQIGSGLTGVLYVLDEPSIGLHQRDNERCSARSRLRDLGNSVVVVEHDEDAILQADYVVTSDRARASTGGRIVAQGTPAEVMADPAS